MNEHADPKQRVPKKTRKWVLIADKVSDKVITVGGILVIGAVLGMMVFLVWEVLPLFKKGTIESQTFFKPSADPNPTLAAAIDEYDTIAVSIDNDGKLAIWHPTTGTPLQGRAFDFNGKRPSSFATTLDNIHFAFGFSDGTVRFGRLRFANDIITNDDVPNDLKKLDEFSGTNGNAVFTKISAGQSRKVSLETELEEEIKVSEDGKPISHLDYDLSTVGEHPKKVVATLDADGNATVSVSETKVNLFTQTTSVKTDKVALPPLPSNVRITNVLTNERGDQAFFIDKKGKVLRYNIQDSDKPFLAETLQVLPEGKEITASTFLMGDTSLVIGGSDGSVSIFFVLQKSGSGSRDGLTLVNAREFPPHTSAVTRIAVSQRGKTFATCDARGEIWLRHGTSMKTILKVPPRIGDVSWEALTLAPRMNGLLAVANDGVAGFWQLDAAHPEVSLHTLFGKVWYEGYPEPSYTWQSSGGTDAFEPKLSLVPLIFGTLKATLYSLLFAIPIALLGAIYTSEFLPANVRGKVKPIMEIMASIPSVVLGFVAALVLAPIVENWIAAVLLSFLVLPVMLVLAAFLWQLAPTWIAVRLDGLPKFGFMFVVVGLGLYITYLMGPVVENLFFDGSFKLWLNGSGSPVPILFVLCLPFTSVFISWSFSRFFGFRFSGYMRTLVEYKAALLDLFRWLGIALVSAALAYIASLILTALGADPRPGLLGTYVQRNTLIIGFAMGFTVIPIIYTLAEDALNAVPDHLRSASFGCGATPWQTALWIILPTALSGVFSAIMIGMGRAVGETMIVVMAAGNTPLIDMNIFSGLRALSANIAVELPEAPKDGTLYRVLFLTALVLFAMTSVINTAAELVRLRFRKRAMSL
jgi:phosphate transport system permease protein